MADINPFASIITDPRMMLAMQLMQGAGDASPVRSGWQEAARALQPLVGAMMLKQGQQNQMAALQDIYGIGSPGGGAGGASAQPQEAPGLFQRIGNFFTGGGSSSDAANTAGPSRASATSGTPASSDSSSSPSASGMPSPNAGSSAAPTASVSSNPTFSGPFARQTWQAYRMIQVGQQRGLPTLVGQGMQMLQTIQQEQAKASAEAVKDGKNIVWGPDGTPTIASVNGYDQTTANTASAKTKAEELARLDPSITQGKIGQTNALNIGTMGTDAAKAGAVAGAEAGARNASDLAYAGPKAYATTDATNRANAGRPLTPTERNEQEQKLGENFRGSETFKEYSQTAQGYKNVLSAAQGSDKASDINLIDGLVKMFNPGATVRQATFETFLDHSQGLPQNVIGMVQSWYSNGQHLQPETRAQLLVQAQNRMASSRENYQQQATSLASQAQSQGLNPKNVIPAYVDPLTAQEELARRRAAAAQGQQQQPIQLPGIVQP